MRYFNWFTTFKLSLLALLIFIIASSNAGTRNFEPKHPLPDTTKKDSAKYETYKSLPLKPARKINFTTTEGSWMSVDVSPDGQTILFDMMGDLYTVPVTGGKATQLTKGLAYDVHPRYSPDGKKILFVSDRSGADNLWCFDTEKNDTLQLTDDNNQNFPDACWTPDGDYIVYAKGRLAIKLYIMYRKGGGGAQLIDAPSNLKVIDPAINPDGRYIYYSQRDNAWRYNAILPQYQVGLYDREKGKTSVITSRYGSAFTPVLSKDGKWLVYGSRFEDKTGLVLRDLKTGDEKWLAYPVQRDEQESIAPLGVLPAMAFTPDSKALIATYGGKIHRIPVDGSAITDIPFTVDLQLELGPQLAFKYPVSDTAYQQASQIRDVVPSPDGKKLAFTVLNRLYIMDYPNGTPQRLTSNEFTEAEPAWSPDGNSIVFTTWNAEGGNLYKVSVAGKNKTTQKLTSETGLYQTPVFNPGGDKIVFIRSKKQVYKNSYGPTYEGGEDELCWIGTSGSDITVIDRLFDRYNPHFVTKEPDRIYLTKSNGDLLSINWSGSDEKKIAHITGITTFGFAIPTKMGRPDPEKMDGVLEAGDEDAKETNLPSPASWITMSPTGDRALAQINNDIYVVTLPKTGKVNNITLADASKSEFPARKLTEVGGEFPAWQNNGKTVDWSLGSTHFTYNLDSAEHFEDSVAAAKKAEVKRIADSTARVNADTILKKQADSLKVITDSIKAKDTTNKKKDVKKEEPKYKGEEHDVKVYFKKDIPQGTILFKNARIITMNGREVIENGDILIENNRIKAVGKSGTLSPPAGAKVMDMSGKTILPGFVDPHSHMWPNWGIHKNQVWIYAANLAYGVTATRDPQTSTTDVFTYSDMVDAGLMMGPRVYSTGPGVGFWAYNIKDSAMAENALMQYSKYYHTKYIKMYLTGNRKQREWIIMAAQHQQLMPTTEGGLDFKLNMTNLLDGYPGHEHALPIYPLYNDVFKTIAAAKMIVTPTLLVSYGGPFAENYFWTREQPYKDPKVQNFFAYEELASKTRRVGGSMSYSNAGWTMDEEQVFPKHAKNMKKLVEDGGMVGVGSHGEFQGLGYHWELWALQSGGMSTMDVLRCATILGATGLGLDKDLGSLEAGKLADLIILDKNPLDNIRNSNTIQYVMKNGRLYEGNTCNEVYPQQRQLDKSEWQYDKPAVNTDEKE